MSQNILIRVGSFTVLAVFIGIAIVHYLGEPKGSAIEPTPPHTPPQQVVQRLQPSTSATPGIQTAALRKALTTPLITAQPELLEGPMEILPPDTVSAIILPSWSRTTDLVDLDGLLDQFRDKLTHVDQLLADCGIDMTELLYPANLGIDPDGPVVFAWLDVRQTTALVGFRVKDSALLEQTIGNVLTYTAEQNGTQYHTEQQGDALVTFDAETDARVALIRRPGVAFIAIHDSWRGNVETAAAQLAWQDPVDSLITTDIWNDTMNAVHGEHGLVFVNFPAITQQAAFALEEDQKQWEQMEYMQEDESWREMQQNRNDAARNLLEAVVGSLRGFGAAIETSGPRVDLDARVILAPDSFLDGFVRNRALSSPLQRAFRESPIFWLDGALEPTKLKEIVQMLAMLSGGNPDDVMRMAANALGIEGNPLDLLDGGLGLAIFMPDSDSDKPGQWGFTVSIGLNDMAQARTAFERASAMANVAMGFPEHTNPDITTIPIPGWQTVHAGLTADALVLTTDMDVLTRLLANENTAVSSWGIRHEIASILGGFGEAGSMMIDYRFVDTSHQGYGTDSGYSEEPAPDASAQQKELWAIDREIEEANRRETEDSAEARKTLSQTLGAMAMSARSEGPTLAIRGTWAFGANDIREAVTQLTNAAWTLDQVTSTNNKHTSQLYERRWQIQESINTVPAEPAVNFTCLEGDVECGTTYSPYME